MRFDKLTIKAQEALQDAQSLAEKQEHQALEVEHLLLALIQQKDGITQSLLERVGADPLIIKNQLEQELLKLPKIYGSIGQIYISPRLKNVLDAAFLEAERLKDDFVSTEHILLAIAEEKGEAAARILAGAGVGRDSILKALLSLRGSQRVTDPNPEDKYQTLTRYCRDNSGLRSDTYLLG